MLAWGTAFGERRQPVLGGLMATIRAANIPESHPPRL